MDWRDNPDAHLQGAVGAWRTAFIRMPYNREQLTPRGIISDTFETAITWDRFEEFYNAIRDATQSAIREVTGHDGAVSCRFSHAYPGRPRALFRLPRAPATPTRCWNSGRRSRPARQTP